MIFNYWKDIKTAPKDEGKYSLEGGVRFLAKDKDGFIFIWRISQNDK